MAASATQVGSLDSRWDLHWSCPCFFPWGHSQTQDSWHQPAVAFSLSRRAVCPSIFSWWVVRYFFCMRSGCQNRNGMLILWHPSQRMSEWLGLMLLYWPLDLSCVCVCAWAPVWPIISSQWCLQAADTRVVGGAGFPSPKYPLLALPHGSQQSSTGGSASSVWLLVEPVLFFSNQWGNFCSPRQSWTVWTMADISMPMESLFLTFPWREKLSSFVYVSSSVLVH
jgi:hypothetical protein